MEKKRVRFVPHLGEEKKEKKKHFIPDLSSILSSKSLDVPSAPPEEALNLPLALRPPREVRDKMLKEAIKDLYELIIEGEKEEPKDKYEEGEEGEEGPDVKGEKEDIIKYAVVLTISYDRAHTKDKTPEVVRKRLMEWATGYLTRHHIRVIDGPWLDDNETMEHPHVNMTVLCTHRLHREIFGFWRLNKGFYYINPVVHEHSWRIYSQRNHETCTALRDGFITLEEAKKAFKKKVQKE